MRDYNERDAIRNLQRYLRQLSYTDPEIPSLPIDGIFDTATRDALLSFQKQYGLPQTGRADRVTWDTLYGAYEASRNANSTPLSVPVFPRIPAGYVLKKGDQYYLVSIVQLLLNELNLVYDGLIPLFVNNEFDDATESNIMEFQSRNNLPVTGEVDQETWNRLVRQFRQYATDYVK